VSTTETSAGYDVWSSTYDQDDNPMIVMADRALADLLPHVRGQRVLELGCGTGRNADALLAAGAASYVGVDGSAGMLARACERITDPRASWVLGDLLDHALAPGAYDLVLFSLVLEHVAAPAAALTRAASALVPGGVVRAHEIHPQLRAGGTQAHYVAGGVEVPLASFAHTVASLCEAAVAAGLELVSTTDRYATAIERARSAKLAKHRGRPVLLELTARRC
jgi:ubiquinone/menaquinone biosynthesis C-methylase UbiE